MKTNKSFSKRIKITGKGKLLTRKPGQNHFNAKARRTTQLSKKKSGKFVLNAKNMSRFLPN